MSRIAPIAARRLIVVDAPALVFCWRAHTGIPTPRGAPPHLRGIPKRARPSPSQQGGYTVCASHGAKGAKAAAFCRSRAPDPVAQAERKLKRQCHREYTRLRQAGLALTPRQESFQRWEKRTAREYQAGRRQTIARGQLMTDMEREFREASSPRPRARPLYPA